MIRWARIVLLLCAMVVVAAPTAIAIRNWHLDLTTALGVGLILVLAILVGYLYAVVDLTLDAMTRPPPD